MNCLRDSSPCSVTGEPQACCAVLCHQDGFPVTQTMQRMRSRLLLEMENEAGCQDGFPSPTSSLANRRGGMHRLGRCRKGGAAPRRNPTCRTSP